MYLPEAVHTITLYWIIVLNSPNHLSGIEWIVIFKPSALSGLCLSPLVGFRGYWNDVQIEYSIKGDYKRRFVCYKIVPLKEWAYHLISNRWVSLSVSKIFSILELSKLIRITKYSWKNWQLGNNHMSEAPFLTPTLVVHIVCPWLQTDAALKWWAWRQTVVLSVLFRDIP